VSPSVNGEGGPTGDDFGRRKLPRGLTLRALVPNAITSGALCCGLTGIRFAIGGDFKAAVLAIILAGMLDGIDGRVARLMKAQSRFGAELDSLSDAISFGVAPALVLYLWSLQQMPRFGWFAALALAVCCALRLARFNSRLGAPDLPPWAFNYFTGVPAPAGAALVLLPMILGFEAGSDWAGHPLLVVPWTLLIAGLMVSTIPTFSFKGLRVPQQYVVPVLVGVGLLAAALASQPWWTLVAIGLAYMASFPFSIRQFQRLQAAAALIQTPPPAEPSAVPEEAQDARPTAAREAD